MPATHLNITFISNQQPGFEIRQLPGKTGHSKVTKRQNVRRVTLKGRPRTVFGQGLPQSVRELGASRS